jgi:carbohydrate diacid regulator
MDAGYERYLVFTDIESRRDADNVYDKCCAIQKELKENSGISVYMGIGRICNSIDTMKEGYERAAMLLDSALLGLTDKLIVRITDIPLERMIMEAAEYYEGKNLENRIRNILQDKNSSMYMELILNWCESMFNFAETARRLGVHKNTLTYRFEKLKEDYGVDLHDFGATIAIYLCIRITKLNK